MKERANILSYQLKATKIASDSDYEKKICSYKPALVSKLLGTRYFK